MTANNRAEFDRLAGDAMWKFAAATSGRLDGEAIEELFRDAAAVIDAMHALASEDGRRDAVPKGWKVVARQPTRLMTIAGREWADNEYETWQAMFDAAPVPPTGEAE